MNDALDLTADDAPPERELPTGDLFDRLRARGDAPPSADDQLDLEAGGVWPDELPPTVTEADVRGWLELAGEAANAALPGTDVLPDAWKATQRDLEDITPPLTRIINRHPRMARVVASGAADSVLVAWYTGRYAVRNVTDIREARAEAEPPPTLSSTRGDAPPPPFDPGDPNTWPTASG